MFLAAFTSALPVSAGPAAEDGLALARLPVPGPARRARLTGVRGVYLLGPARGLLLKTLGEQAPPGREDAPVKSCPGAGAVRGNAPGWSGSGFGAGFRVMFGTRRSSMRMRSYRRAMLVEVFSAQSFRLPASRARVLASRAVARFRRLLPRLARDRRRARRSVRGDEPGAWYVSPKARARDTATPRSMPVTSPVPGPSIGAGMTANATCQRPTRSRVIRYDLAPGTFRLRRKRTQPAFGS